MSNRLSREHALQTFLEKNTGDSVACPGVHIEVRPFLSYFNLRGDANDRNFLKTAETVLGQELPLRANSTSMRVHNIYWLGPDEWLIETKNDRVTAPELRDHLSQYINAVTDVSGGQIHLYLSGPQAREILAKGCTLDFHASAFTTGQCAQTGLASSNILISKPGDDFAYSIIVRRSFAEYLALWLYYAGNEFGITFTCAE